MVQHSNQRIGTVAKRRVMENVVVCDDDSVLRNAHFLVVDKSQRTRYSTDRGNYDGSLQVSVFLFGFWVLGRALG